jgi:hypothetical protein
VAISSAAGTRITLLSSEPLGHRPHHRQLAVGLDAGHLLGVERQVVAQHAGGLLGGHLGHGGHIVQHAGDVVEQEEQAGGHGGRGWLWNSSPILAVLPQPVCAAAWPQRRGAVRQGLLAMRRFTSSSEAL